MAQKFPSLYRKTLTSFLLVIGAVVLVGGLLGTKALERQAIGQLTQSLVRAARLMEPEIRQALVDSPTVIRLQPLVSQLGQQADCRVTVIDLRGVVLGDSEQTEASLSRMENHRDRPEVQAALAGGIGSSLRYSTTVKHPMLYVALPLARQDQIVGVLRVAVPATVVVKLWHQIRTVMLVSLLIGLVVASILGTWLARRVARPLRQLTRTAEAYAKGDFTQHAQGTPVQEVQALAETLNAMAQAIRRHVDELTTERNQAAAILESMAEGVIALDTKGRVLLSNPSVRSLLDLASPQVTGQSLFEVVRHHEVEELLREVLQNRQRVTQDLRIFQPKERSLRIHAVPCQGCGPSGPCAVLVIQDVTEHDRYEALRREFVANVSHELKSPLTGIQNMTETLLGGALHDAANNERFVRLIDEEAQRLSRLIEDLLSLSQLESRAEPLRRTRLELKPLIDSVVSSLRPGVDQRRLAVSIECPSGLIVNADPDRLRQVFVNLIDNAIKYNKDKGTVIISAAQDNDRLTITVADTGIGIPQQDLPRVFERFYRVDKARSRDLGGTGLGLSIVKHIVETHGGTVSVTSKLGQGSTFSFILPLRS